MLAAHRMVRGIVAMTLAVAASPAWAQEASDSWFYVGAAAGRVDYSQDESYYAPFRTYPWSDDVTLDLVEMRGVDLESSQRTERYHVGYRANRYLALEVGYTDLGVSEQSTFCPGNLAGSDPIVCIPEAYGYSRSTARRADFTASVILPIGNRFELMGKLGVARTKHTTYFYHVDVEYFTGLVHGVGARFFITPAWALRLDLDRSEIPASRSNHHPATKTLDSAWLGVEYGFR